jgi:hypothetical protein
MPTVARLTNIREQYFDTAGEPLAGGLLYFYEAGSATPTDTYTTSAGSSANTNPIILDSYGRPQVEIWLDISVNYKAVLATAADVPIWTEDNIVAVSPTLTPTFLDSDFKIAGSSNSSKILVFEVDGLTASTTRVLTAQDKNGSIALTAEFDYANLATNGRIPYPLGYISGLICSNNSSDATNDVDISPGACRDSTNAHNLILASLHTKRIDASWSLGSGNGGLDGTESSAGTPDTSTWYYVHLIKRSDSGVVDALFSESATAPTLPLDYDYSRIIGAVYNNSSGDIDQFTSLEVAGGGLEVWWTTPTLDVNLANTLTTSRRTDAYKTPAAFATFALIRVKVADTSAAGHALITCPDEADATVDPNAAPLVNIRWLTSFGEYKDLEIRTDATGLIAARATVATVDSYLGVTRGFRWGRR